MKTNRFLPLLLALALVACGGSTKAVSPTATPAVPPAAASTAVVAPTSAPAPTATSAPAPATATPAPVAATVTPRPAATATPIPSDPAAFLGNASPPANFCTYAGCIPNFIDGRGYVIQCRDGLYSKSGGISGACSGHGGVLR